MDSEAWWPEEVMTDRPSVARFYDYLLGGYHNFESDRAVVEKMMRMLPDLRLVAQVNRSFLRRAVRTLVDLGIDQFLDIGSGIPTLGNVHEVAQKMNPAARVVYVDVEPVAITHARAMLKDNPLATAIWGDVRRPQEILQHPEVQGLLDFGRPVGLLLVALMHYVVDDEDAYRVVRELSEALAPGSYLTIAHSTFGARRAAISQEMMAELRTARDTRMRTREQIERFFEGWELAPPGLVLTPLWRPEGEGDLFVDDPERGCTYAALARK